MLNIQQQIFLISSMLKAIEAPRQPSGTIFGIMKTLTKITYGTFCKGYFVRYLNPTHVAFWRLYFREGR